MSNLIWEKEPNDILKSFIQENIGAIETNKNNPEGLQILISHSNSNNN
jgi:hypothetical protein